MRRAIAGLLLAGLAWTGPAVADAPLAPPEQTVCSLGGKVCATREPDQASTLVWRKDGKAGRTDLWRVPILPDRVEISDDGQVLVELYPGLNLLALDASADTPVLVFHRQGRAAVTIRLNQVVAQPEALPQTVSHRQWARAYGFDGRGRYVLETAEGRHFLFDPKTGQPVEGALLP